MSATYSWFKRDPAGARILTPAVETSIYSGRGQGLGKPRRWTPLGVFVSLRGAGRAGLHGPMGSCPSAQVLACAEKTPPSLRASPHAPHLSSTTDSHCLSHRRGVTSGPLPGYTACTQVSMAPMVVLQYRKIKQEKGKRTIWLYTLYGIYQSWNLACCVFPEAHIFPPEYLDVNIQIQV